MTQPILLFDGVCNFCDASVNFIISRDSKAQFKFASLQSGVGQELLTRFGLPTKDFDSFVFVDGDHYYTKSSAALMVLRGLGGIWALLYVFMLVPKPLRDAVYGLIARNRYRLFGKKDECLLPSPEVRARFLA